MPTTIDKEWAAVDGDDVVLRGDNKEVVERELRRKGLESEGYDIVALPKSHSSMFV